MPSTGTGQNRRAPGTRANPARAHRLAPSLAWIALVLLLAACGDVGRGRRPEPLNVVMIVIDDLGWKDAAVLGSSFYETPNIDRLAASGVRFTQFYTASPVCSPTRASLMTGKAPARVHITNWIGGEQQGPLLQADYLRQLPLEEVTVGEAFREAGYVTGYVGKWHLGGPGYLPDAQGFDVMKAVNHAGQPGSYFYPYESANRAATNVPDLGDGRQGEYLTDRLTDESLRFLRAHRDGPFFFVLSHYAVHTPLQAPDEVIEPYRTKARALGSERDQDYRRESGRAVTKLRQDHPVYAAMIERIDASVGRILDELDDLGIADHAVVVFVSDNGGLSTLLRRSASLATSNAPLRAGKGWLYEGGIRAPLIMRGPGVGVPGSLVETPALSTDLYPTLLNMAGLEPRPLQHVDGVSLAPQLRGGAAPAHDALFWHFPHYHGSGNTPGGAIRVGDLKLVEWFEGGRAELYDLARDPGETHDLAQERPADVTRLQDRLERWRVEVGAWMPRANPDWGGPG